VQLQCDAEFVGDISLRLVASDVVHLRRTHARRGHQQQYKDEIGISTTMALIALNARYTHPYQYKYRYL
jgi:hypothetical protein